MGLSDRDYMQPKGEPPDDLPPARPKLWIIVVAIVLVAVFILPVLLQFVLPLIGG